MSAAINYASIPTAGAATLTTGDVSRTAPAAAANLLTPVAGAQIERITVTPLATTTATVLRIFRYDGAAYHLYMEVPIEAITVSASQPVTSKTFQAVDQPGFFPIIIPTGWSLRAQLNDAQTGIKVQAEGGGY